MNLALLFRITGIVLFIQLALGGLVTFGYLDPIVHVVWGVVLGAFVVVTLVSVVRMPSKPRQLVGLTVGIGVDVVIQALLGFAAMASGSNVISWVHFLNAMAIYGMTFFGTFMAMRAGQMASGKGSHPAVQT